MLLCWHGYLQYNHGGLSEAEEDLCCVLWARMWLRRPKADAHMRLQMGHGTPRSGAVGADANLWRRSRAAVRRCVLASSKFEAASRVRERQRGLSRAAFSRSLGCNLVHFRLPLTLSLNLFFGRPWLRLPVTSSP